MQNSYMISNAKFLHRFRCKISSQKKEKEEDEFGATQQSVDRDIQVHPLATINGREL